MWQVSDDTPKNYTVLVDGSPEENGAWDGSDVSVSIPNPGVGEWNITLLVYDQFDNSASDSVFVEVRAVPFSVDLVLIGGVLGSVIVVVVLVYYYKSR